MNKRLFRISIYTALSVGAFTMMIPFLWMISTSLKAPPEIMKNPPIWIPKVFEFNNYSNAYAAAPFGIYLINSLIVTVVTTLGQLITSILASFAFARLRFWGQKVIFIIFLSTMMIPLEMLIIPNFVTLANLKLINTYWALILPWLVSVFAIFTLKQAFQSVPDEIYYAAKIDGCSDWKYLWGILVPMSKNSLVAISILQVIGSWNSFMWPLIVTNDERFRTLPVGLQAFTTDAGTDYGQLMAASGFVIVPMIILYLILQKHIIAGISKGGLKG